MTPNQDSIDGTDLAIEDLIQPTRTAVRLQLRMRERRLLDGTPVRFTFDTDLGMPHLSFYSHHLSPTGYQSDFFGRYGQELSEAEIAEAFDVRANRLSEAHKAEMLVEAQALAKAERRRAREARGREMLQLPLGF